MAIVSTRIGFERPRNRSGLRLSLRAKMMVGFALVGLLAATATAYGFYANLRGQVLDEFKLRVNSTARLAAQAQNGDEFATIVGPDSATLEQFRLAGAALLDANPEITRMLLLRRDEQGFFIVLDAADQEAAPFGERYTSGSALEEHFDSLTGAFSDPQISTARVNPTLSAYAPLFASDGTRVGAAVVTLDASSVVQKQNQALLTALVVVAVVIALALLLGYLLSNLLANPFIRLSQLAQSTASGDSRRRYEIRSGDEAEDLAGSLSAMAAQLRDVVDGLEARVRERSREADVATEEADRRVLQLETVSEVARTIATVRDLDQILPAITRVISQRFNYYHVGIFLVDERQEYAILQAANSSGGRKMMERGHKLRLEATSIVGYAASRNTPRIALDVGADSVFLKNPNLPETRSELALPLVLSGQVIGVLDVQSIEPNAFSQEDVNALSVLANQVATALENARLFSETRASLEESRKSARELVGRDWTTYYRWLTKPGYKYDGANLKPLDAALESADVAEVTVQGETLISPDDSTASKMIVPIKLRGEVIGIVNIEANAPGRKWSRDEVTLAQAAAERASLALENARLVHEAQRRAAKERTIGEISGKIGSLIDIDNILQTAAQELGRTMPGAEVIIQFQNNDKH